MRKGFKKIGLGLVAVGMCLALLGSTAVPGRAAPAEEQRVVKIGMHAAFTGPWANIAANVCKGFIDYVTYQSDEGLIHGVPLEVTWEDSGASVSRTIVAHKRFVYQGAVLEMHWNSTPVDTLTPKFRADNMPVIYYGCYTPPMITEPLRWIFSINPGWKTVGWSLSKWAADNLAVEGRPVRLGLIGYDNVSARDGIEGHKIAQLRDINCEIVGVEWVSIATIDTSTELLRLAAQKPDIIGLAASGCTLVVIAKDFVRLGLKEQGIKAATYLGSITGEGSILEIGKDFEGFLCQFGWPVASEVDWDLPGEKIIREIAQRYRGMTPEKVWGDYISGCMHAMVAVEGIRLAIEKVGLEDLTSSAVRDGLASIKDFDTGLIPPITMSDKGPWYNPYVRMYVVQEGRFELLTDWEKTPWFLDYFEKQQGG